VALSLLLVAGACGAGYRALRFSWPSGESIPVGVVQPNVPLHSPVSPEDAELCRMAYPEYTDLLMSGLSLSLTEPGGFVRPELVVWPETAFPTALNLQPDFVSAAARTAMLNRVHLLMGALEARGAGAWCPARPRTCARPLTPSRSSAHPNGC